jgi:hypothetical protein
VPIDQKIVFIVLLTHAEGGVCVYYVGADVSPETCEIQHNIKQKKKMSKRRPKQELQKRKKCDQK